MHFSTRDFELIKRSITLLIESGENENEVARLKGKILDLNTITDSCPQCGCDQFSCGYSANSNCYTQEE